ncbi:MAG: PRC-barrel domain-containing protein [Pseudomonadales bacterium]
MKKLHSFAFYALVTPVITLAAGSALAQQAAGQDPSHDQSTQRDQDTTRSTTRTPAGDQSTQRTGQSTPGAIQSDPGSRQSGQSSQSTSQPSTAQSNQSSQRAGQSDSQTAAERLNASNQSRMQNREYLSSAPANGMHASTLIGAEVSTSDGEDLGSVDDLIIDEDGQVVAIVVGVGGFLGMAEKNVAIGWGRVTQSGTGEEQELRVDLTREELRSAPEFEETED